MRDLTITASATPSAQIFTLTGALDLDTLDECAHILRASSRQLPPPRVIVLDLRSLQFVSAAGGRALQAFTDETRERGLTTRLVVDPTTFLSRVLDVLDLERRLARFPTLEAASTPLAD
jgi:anti-anti-sigma factor